MDVRVKLKLTPKQLEVFVLDWQTNYKNISFNDYFDNLLKECENDLKNDKQR